ncbi:MAG TPA: VTT domain-containing protein [Bryobacteraceae bacterium]|nr:VTT domain-containing protein [Bryobacteraceae bacterium]
MPLVGGVDAFVVVVAVANHSAAWTAAGAAIIGSLAGSLVLFYIARKGGEAYLAKYTSTGRGAQFRRWFERYGLITVFVPAAVPIPMPMKVFVLSAGAMEVSPATFSIVLLAARVPRYFALAWLGTRLGAQTLPYLKTHMWTLVLIALALCVVLVLAVRLVERSRAGQASL